MKIDTQTAITRRLHRLSSSNPTAAAVVGKLLDLENTLETARLAVRAAEEREAQAARRYERVESDMLKLEHAGIPMQASLKFVTQGVDGPDGLTDEVRSADVEADTASVPTRSGVDASDGPHVRSSGHSQNGRGHMDKRDYATTLRDVMQAGCLSAGDTLIARYKGSRHEAHLQRDGSLHVDGYGPAPTLSAAGRFITPGEINGWRFWGIERSDGWVPLADVRDDYLLSS